MLLQCQPSKESEPKDALNISEHLHDAGAPQERSVAAPVVVQPTTKEDFHSFFTS